MLKQLLKELFGGEGTEGVMINPSAGLNLPG